MVLSRERKRKSEANDKSRKRTKQIQIVDDQSIIEKAQISAGPTEKQTDPLERQRKLLAYKTFLNRAGPDAPGSKIIPRGAEGCLRSLTFVITGVLTSLERDECKKIIENYAGRVTTAVSGKTNYLIAGRDAGKSKTEKAEKLGIKIINEDELIEMIRTRPENTNLNKEKQKPNLTRLVKVKTESFNEEIQHDDDLLWIEKYKPSLLTEIVGQQTEKSPMKKLIYFLTHWDSSDRNSTNSSKHKAVLLVGPSGSGKTTTARLVCKALNMSFIENELTTSQFVDKTRGSSKQVLIIDELETIRENDKRLGLSMIIEHLKKTSIPIILITNDRSSSNVRFLMKYCEEIRFQRPSLLNIKSRLLEICSNERIRISQLELDHIIQTSNRDLRKIIQTLNFYYKKSSLVLKNLIKSEKVLPSSPFDACMKLFTTKNLNITDRQNFYFYDTFLMGLLIQENYVRVVPNSLISRLKLLSRAADSLALADIFSRLNRTDSSRTLYNYESIFSAAIPASYLHGSLSTVHFPKTINFSKKEEFHFLNFF